MIGDALQRAIYTALKGAGICEGRIYDRPPMDAVMPYVTIGDEQDMDMAGSCGPIWDISTDLHVWDAPEGASKVAIKTIGAAIVPLLTSGLVVAGQTVTVAALSTSRVFRDPDGVTEHAVLTFRFVLTPN